MQSLDIPVSQGNRKEGRIPSSDDVGGEGCWKRKTSSDHDDDA